ncbi:MAG: alanine--tRNA ligase [Candidatus Pacebacteria bacterium]|nr:alanine--tRNA ligase [Candidatus Paceibacterota bacterium]MBP9058127.1 alanine--tRNA ligase [Candidatus Paceibacterota bacterium]MBP9770109.1 alanine--tRNA ligase [Candidatus Paceibacterota bacterium]
MSINMNSSEIRKRFLDFFEKRGHSIVPSAPLVPQNDPSVLFNTAGMQPLVPYLMGERHPLGSRIADIQKCVRTGDLEDIGDNRHFSFFEMMGNWSLGDYFKDEAIKWSYEFLTSKEEGLGLDPNLLYVTIFEGDENAPLDEESKNIWMSLGIPENRIYALPAEDNWWSPGDNGPCGPCSEMFYDMTGGSVGDLNKESFIQSVKDERVIEIWNDVFMEYEKKEGKVVGKLAQKNVDTGAGLERMTAVMKGKNTAYDTDIFENIMVHAKTLSPEISSQRVIADHMRTAVFMIADGVIPSNTKQGYVLRRLIRRAVLKSENKDIGSGKISVIVDSVVSFYEEFYPEIKQKTEIIKTEIEKEVSKFKETLQSGLKEFEKGTDPFILATTYGFPIEVTLELALEKGTKIDVEDFNRKMEEHQKLSQTSSAGMFKGGLANHNEQTIKLHTAHHLLLSALQQVLGSEVKQRGSNITEERLRMDFAFDRKMTDEEKVKVEEIVNEYISRGLNVVRREMPLTEAEKLGAEMEFGAKYPETVSVYFVEDENGDAISKEFCGGPHVENTSVLGAFKIQKEEASSAGIRRIKAVLS